jgi:hypothetical protein
MKNEVLLLETALHARELSQSPVQVLGLRDPIVSQGRKGRRENTLLGQIQDQIEEPRLAKGHLDHIPHFSGIQDGRPKRAKNP